ncbi:MAG: NPCBM/NEW2 domain-containing protein [Phycisphaerales bacterium]|nr:NPCBM/NEW2 domain-containing protein [Phycisphaerales bacterium]
MSDAPLDAPVDPTGGNSPAADQPLDRHPAPNPAANARTRRAWTIPLLFVAALAGGAALRGWLIGSPNIGHQSDLGFFVQWMRGLEQHGLAGFYDKEGFCDYPPLSVLMLWAGGHVTEAMAGPNARDEDFRIAIKAFACLADLLIGAMLFFEARRRIGPRAGLAAASMFLFNPAVIYNSAFWGQVDSVYTAFLLAALMVVGRRGFGVAGALVAAALGAKFQTVALAPLVLFETYRLGGFRGIGRWLLGAALAFGVIVSPFGAAGVMFEALGRSYVNVVGQYHELSKSAFNIWYFTEAPLASDTNPPMGLVLAAANGELRVREDASFWLKLSWRRISLALYATVVAVILSLYSLRPGGSARCAAAGLLGLAFFLFPTEMHERYAFPALALLPVWAATRPRNERLYWLLTSALLINLAAKLSPEALGIFIAICLLVLFACLLGAMVLDRRLTRDDGEFNAAAAGQSDEGSALGGLHLIRAFRGLTVAAVIVVAAMGVWMRQVMAGAAGAPTPTDAAYLSDMIPLESRQGWKTLATDTSVAGGLIRLGGDIYLRGIGTHAPARIVYDIPKGAGELRMLAGIDSVTGAGGSAFVAVELDDRRVFRSARLIGGGPPAEIAIAVEQARRVTIIVEDGGDGRKADHVDLALARFVRSEAPTTSPTDSASTDPEK